MDCCVSCGTFVSRSRHKLQRRLRFIWNSWEHRGWIGKQHKSTNVASYLVRANVSFTKIRLAYLTVIWATEQHRNAFTWKCNIFFKSNIFRILKREHRKGTVRITPMKGKHGNSASRTKNLWTTSRQRPQTCDFLLQGSQKRHNTISIE